MREAPHAGLSGGEKQALDMFCAAFATMSRIPEIAGLRAVGVDGRRGLTRIRPKATARAWRFVKKKVSNMAGLEARNIIRECEA